MSTTSDRLALLQRTKAGQRALLEEMYPDLDFNTVPFREYGRLFTGRKYVPGFVGGWKGYGRSNAEDPATREILPDYSGNGRDIRLYNFAFSGMSGWGGYVQDSYNPIIRTNNVDSWTITTEGPRVHVRFNTDTNVRLQFAYGSVSKYKPGNNIIRAGVFGLKVYSTGTSGANEQLLLELKPNQVGSFNTANVSQEYIMYKVYEPAPANSTMELEFLPTYPGGLVSDGVDDYGQCVKGFALPDDYTIVAIRRVIEGNSAALASKGASSGAFLFEVLNDSNKSGVIWSYGQTNTLSDAPDLFSYQTKGSYNGREISYGTAEDTSDDILSIFRYSAANHMSAVLYDLRIYDHTLTAEELSIVKDEMMSDYENATGGVSLISTMSRTGTGKTGAMTRMSL